MSEDHSEDHTAASPGQVAAASPGQSAVTCSPGQASPEPDYTPLKKRRLATYNESTEDKGKDYQPVSIITLYRYYSHFKVSNTKLLKSKFRGKKIKINLRRTFRAYSK